MISEKGAFYLFIYGVVIGVILGFAFGVCI